MIVHYLYYVICYCATNAIGPEEQKAYLDTNEDCRKFQMDLALGVMNYTLSLYWDSDPVNGLSILSKISGAPQNLKISPTYSLVCDNSPG